MTGAAASFESNRIETYLLYIYIYVGLLCQCVRSRLFMEFELLAGPNKRMSYWLTDCLNDRQTVKQADALTAWLSKQAPISLT